MATSIGRFNTNSKPNQPYLVDLVTLDSLIFQSIPTDMEYDPSSSFATLESPGRNNPLYHYTGSEDTITFEISWYANDPTREDVISKCKWVESLTKNDGFDAKPHDVQFIFGVMFKYSVFKVVHAPFRMGLFSREFGMLPQIAKQSVTLKRVTEVNQPLERILDFRY